MIYWLIFNFIGLLTIAVRLVYAQERNKVEQDYEVIWNCNIGNCEGFEQKSENNPKINWKHWQDKKNNWLWECHKIRFEKKED